MSKHNQILGDIGEKLAVEYLKKKKYIILEQNYKIKGKEVDIIAQKEEYIVFIEVKTRQSENFGRPAEAVNHSKQQNIIYVAEVFMQQEFAEEMNARFDVMEIIGNQHNGKFTLREISHIEGAFTC